MEFLTPEEVAERLKVSVRWVRDHREALGGIQLGGYVRFTVEALEENVRRIAAEQVEASLKVRPVVANVRPRPLSEADVKRRLHAIRTDGQSKAKGA